MSSRYKRLTKAIPTALNRPEPLAAPRSGGAFLLPMDEDLANIIRQALDEARAAGRDDTGQTEHEVRTVRELRPDMTAKDTLNAINLVRSFL